MIHIDISLTDKVLHAHGECDLPTRRHAQVSRPPLSKGRLMSSIGSISVEKLSRLIGRPDCPVLIDVCTDEDFACNPRLIPGAVRRPWAAVAEWAHEFKGKSVIVICYKGL